MLPVNLFFKGYHLKLCQFKRNSEQEVILFDSRDNIVANWNNTAGPSLSDLTEFVGSDI